MESKQIGCKEGPRSFPKGRPTLVPATSRHFGPELLDCTFLGVAKGSRLGSIRRLKAGAEPMGVCIPCPQVPVHWQCRLPEHPRSPRSATRARPGQASSAPGPQSSSPTWWLGLSGTLGLLCLCSAASTWVGLETRGRKARSAALGGSELNVFPQSIFEREVVLPPGCVDINPLANNKWINNNKVWSSFYRKKRRELKLNAAVRQPFW